METKKNKELEHAIIKQYKEITALDLSRQECIRNGHFEKAETKEKRKQLLIRQIQMAKEIMYGKQILDSNAKTRKL